jgi:hypothetical protein
MANSADIDAEWQRIRQENAKLQDREELANRQLA